jgi:hypothetical protein
MAMRVAIACVVASCGPSEPPKASPAPAPAVKSYPPPPTAPDLDLDRQSTASLELALDGKPARRIVAVPPDARIDITVAQDAGPLVPIAVDVFEPGMPVAFSGTKMQCAERGCSMTDTITVGPGIRWLTVEVAADAPMTVRLSATRK